ncbi:MAG: ribosomal protein S18-alanine N-acetyltransferase [Bacillota bacterium]
MAELYFRPMALEDLDQIIEIERCSFPTPWSAQAFVRELTQNIYARYQVAVSGEMIVAYGGMWLILDESHVTNVAVHPEYRGRGYGEAMMRRLMEVARENGVERMTLEVRPSNLIARALYEKLGFVCRGRRSNYYSDTGEDALIMWKDDLTGGERVGS